MVILIQGAAAAGKSLLARWLGKAHAGKRVVVLELDTLANVRRTLAAAKRENEIIVCVCDWPLDVAKADMEITVRRGTGVEARQCNNRPRGKVSPLSNARRDEK